MQTVNEIASFLEKTDIETLPTVLEAFRTDTRSGVMKLVKKYDKQIEKYQKEWKRLDQMLRYERAHANNTYICGIDEAGRGPLAGPVVAGAVILKKETKILYLNDSKQLSAAMREKLYDEIMECAEGVGVGIVTAERIDAINILQATYEAMRIAVSKLPHRPDLLLNDAVKIPGIDIPQISIVKGDAKSLSIAAASVVAKVTRDRMMVQYDALYPEYGFAAHKGYGSAAHIEAIRTHGISAIHRKTFLKNLLTKEVSEEE